MIFFRSRLPDPPVLRSVNGTLRVVKEGEEKLLRLSEFEKLVGFSFIPQLDLVDASTLHKITKKIKTLHEKGELTRRQLWYGSYYKPELESLFFPDVIYRWIDPQMGWGVFANRPFKKGEFIGEYGGRLRKRKREDAKNAYCFEYSVLKRYTIDAQDQGGVVRFINHSDHPNLITTLATIDWVNHVILIASEPIPKGAQLLYDYGPDYWSRRRCCIIQQSDKSLGIKQLTTTESTEHAEKRDKTARFAPL